MALDDPVAAYNAADNVEAHLVKGLLVEAGVEASVEEDLGGVWVLHLPSRETADCGNDAKRRRQSG
jgi:hypothetical protein